MSSAWLITVISFWVQMAKALAMVALSCTPWPSSVMNFTLAGRVLRWSMLTPSKFSVMETVWFTSHRPTSAAFCSTCMACAAEEQTGLVLGIRFTNV